MCRSFRDPGFRAIASDEGKGKFFIRSFHLSSKSGNAVVGMCHTETFPFNRFIPLLSVYSIAHIVPIYFDYFIM